jgi:hypothetical protein
MTQQRRVSAAEWAVAIEQDAWKCKEGRYSSRRESCRARDQRRASPTHPSLYVTFTPHTPSSSASDNNLHHLAPGLNRGPCRPCKMCVPRRLRRRRRRRGRRTPRERARPRRGLRPGGGGARARVSRMRRRERAREEHAEVQSLSHSPQRHPQRRRAQRALVRQQLSLRRPRLNARASARGAVQQKGSMGLRRGAGGGVAGH